MDAVYEEASVQYEDHILILQRKAWYCVMFGYMEDPGQSAFLAGNQSLIREFVEIVEACDSFQGA